VRRRFQTLLGVFKDADARVVHQITATCLMAPILMICNAKSA
jgi:hypothetical protein